MEGAEILTDNKSVRAYKGRLMLIWAIFSIACINSLPELFLHTNPMLWMIPYICLVTLGIDHSRKIGQLVMEDGQYVFYRKGLKRFNIEAGKTSIHNLGQLFSGLYALVQRGDDGKTRRFYTFLKDPDRALL